LGAVNVQAGFSTVNLNKGTGGNLILTAASLAQTGTGAAANFVAGGGGTLGTAGDNLTFTAAPAQTNGILPYATVAGADFAVYNQGGQTGLSAPAAGFYKTTLAGALATDNVKLTANDVVAAGGQTVNSLILSGNNVAVTGTATLTLGAQALLVTGGSD